MNKLIFGILLSLSFVFVGCSTASDEISDVLVDVESFEEDLVLEGAYNIDSERSVLGWYSERIVGNNHRGTVPILSGSFNFDAQSGDFVMDMTAITEDRDSQMFLNHLKNEDFFDVELFPHSTFTLRSIELVSGNVYSVSGDLLIKDVSNEISFNAQFSENGEFVVARASFSIDRTLWGLTYDSGSVFQQIGDRAIRDNIDYDLKLYFTK